MRKLIAAGIVLGLASGAMGCRFIKRDAKQYSADTTALLETNNASLKECYDGVLKTDPAAAGSVVVQFKLKNETGEIFDVNVDGAKSSAPEPVQECVANSISGLKLDPPDAVEGHATYSYEFQIAPQASEPQATGFTTSDPAG